MTFSRQRPYTVSNGTVSAGTLSNGTLSAGTESAIQLLDYLVGRLVASAAPAVAFSSLAEACAPVIGPRCIVDLVEDSGAVYSIERPYVAVNGDFRERQSYAVTAAATVPTSSLAAAGGSGYYAQVSSACVRGQRPAADQEYLLQHLVDATVELVRRERIHAALDAEHALSAQLRHALERSRDIGMAIGITMNASGITSEQAFEVLSKISQSTNRKLRDVAADLVRTGVQPQVTVTDSCPAVHPTTARHP